MLARHVVEWAWVIPTQRGWCVVHWAWRKEGPWHLVGLVVFRRGRTEDVMGVVAHKLI